MFVLQLKHDHEDCRVMYREGLEGSPFHTLLVEGYMDGPIQDCKFFPLLQYFRVLKHDYASDVNWSYDDAGLCVSWEATLYQKW